jgi:sugar phosphate isomerase/epimerase
VRAQERLDWQLAADAGDNPEKTLFDSIELASELGLAYLTGSSTRRVSATLPKTFGPKLGENERRQIRLKLDDAGLRLLSYRLDRLPDDPEEARQSLEFARSLGAETVILATTPQRLDQAAAWCQELDLRLALHSANPGTDNLLDLAELCRRSGPRTGLEIDLGELMQLGLDPVETLRPIKDQLFVVHLAPALPQQDNNLPPPADNDPWLKAIRFHEIAPVLFTFDLEAPAPAATRAAFDAMTTRLTR